MPTVLDEYGYRFQLGKAAELRTGRDVVLISTGLMTMRALQAAARLEADHVDVAVLHVPTIKPLDREAILRVARTDRLVVTLENHTVIGGLSEAVASTLAFAGVGTRVVPIALPDEFLAAGALPTLHDRYGLSTDAIVSKVKAELGGGAPPTPRRPPSDRPFGSAGLIAARWPCTSGIAVRPPCCNPRRPRLARSLPDSVRLLLAMENPMSVSDHTAVVTGAGSKRGIGRATAHALAAAGWNVAVLDLDEAGAKDVADEIAEQHGVQAVGVGCDVTDAASVENALATVAGAVPPVGAVVNNAGITSPTPFLEVTADEWERIFAVNVRGSYNVTRQLAPGLVERGFGRIVFLSSVSAERGGGVFGGVAYSAAKAGQLGFARALARELGPNGVTVNSVAPGLIDTDITAGKLVGEKEKQVLAGVPVGRKGRAADVADLITYLCREESGYITGATYDVNGGAHIH